MNKLKAAVLTVCGIFCGIMVSFACYWHAYIREVNLTFEGACGKRIYMSAAKNGLGSDFWPSDISPRLNFTNSTDYFSALMDEKGRGTSKWAPIVVGLERRTVSWRGTRINDEGSGLNPDDNMWTVAKNIAVDTPSVIPVLITRNVLATSLRTRLNSQEMNKKLKFDESTRSPIGNKFVAIRKDGSMFKATKKFVAYGIEGLGGSYHDIQTNRLALEWALL